MLLTVRSSREMLSSRRPGKASLMVLLAMPTMLLAMSLAFYAAELVETRTYLRNASDAAALAGVQSLVDDSVLLNQPQQMYNLINTGRQQAQNFAQLNPVMGQGLPLQANTDNFQDGDIVFATLNPPKTSRTLLMTDTTVSSNPCLLSINTVRVTGRRNRGRNNPVPLNNGPYLSHLPDNASAVATATLDSDVIGFRPQGTLAIPMVPIALFSDAVFANPPGQLNTSWEYQVERGARRIDAWKIVKSGNVRSVQSGSDGLYEMSVNLGTNPPSKKPDQAALNNMLKQGQFNACLLQIGAGDVADLARQIVSGITTGDIQQFTPAVTCTTPGPLTNQFVLQACASDGNNGQLQNQLIVPGTPWYSLQTNNGGGDPLQNALNQLQSTAAACVWPLFSSFDPNGMPVISGFVAARVVNVPTITQGGRLVFTVQPARMSTATAVTDPTRRGIGTVRLPNPYVCKVRLVE